MKKILLSLAAASLSVSLAWAQAGQPKTDTKAAPKAPAAKKISYKMPADLKWEDIPGATGVQRATLWGNPDKGAYGALVKFAAGTEVPLHTHTADVRIVVLSGTVLSGNDGERPKEFAPQSYISQPGGAKHTTGCKRGADCIFFSIQPAAFDLKPVEPAASKK